MTKQEIKKAIENGESVWTIKEIDNTEKRIFLVISNDVVIGDNYCYIYDDLGFTDVYEYKEIFKTKAEAEHYLHHANITRTETLPFLTWEEFCEQKFIWFIDKNQNECCLYYLNVSNKIFINVSGEVKEIGDLTEANFYKAYDECVRLFKGEE